MPYRVEFLPSAGRELASLPREVQVRVAARIEGLKEVPRPQGARVLQGGEGLLRVRVRDYRVIYRVEDEDSRVLVVAVGHRREVYRRR